MAAIARGIGRTRQSVRELTDKLVADGLAETIANEADRRAPLVRITDQGNAVLHDVGPRQLRWATRLAEGFTSEELRTTLKVLQRLEASLTETEGDT
jgi:DNA-binding MarR family transcriptional regulator